MDTDGYGCTPIGIPIGIPIVMGAPNVGIGAPNVGMGAPIGMPNVGCCCLYSNRVRISTMLTAWLAVFVKVQERRDAGDADRQHRQHHCQLCLAAEKEICLLCVCFPSGMGTHTHSRNIACNTSKATFMRSPVSPGHIRTAETLHIAHPKRHSCDPPASYLDTPGLISH